MHALMGKSSGNFPGLNSLRHHWTLESVGDEVWAKQISAVDSDSTRAIVENIVNEFRQYLSTAKDLPRLEFFYCWTECPHEHLSGAPADGPRTFFQRNRFIENFEKWRGSLRFELIEYHWRKEG